MAVCTLRRKRICLECTLVNATHQHCNYYFLTTLRPYNNTLMSDWLTPALSIQPATLPP
jgi:hypothetical protein